MRLEEWISAWSTGETGAVVFVTFDREFVRDVALSEQDRLLLTQYGLPDSAAPYLSFDASPGMLSAVRAASYAPEGTDAFVEIGMNGSGDPICLRSTDGAVFYLNHDNEFGAVLINSSVSALADFLLLYRDLIQDALAMGGPDAYQDGEFPADALARAERRGEIVDRAAPLARAERGQSVLCLPEASPGIFFVVCAPGPQFDFSAWRRCHVQVLLRVGPQEPRLGCVVLGGARPSSRECTRGERLVANGSVPPYRWCPMDRPQ